MMRMDDDEGFIERLNEAAGWSFPEEDAVLHVLHLFGTRCLPFVRKAVGWFPKKLGGVLRHVDLPTAPPPPASVKPTGPLGSDVTKLDALGHLELSAKVVALRDEDLTPNQLRDVLALFKRLAEDYFVSSFVSIAPFLKAADVNNGDGIHVQAVRDTSTNELYTVYLHGIGDNTCGYFVSQTARKVAAEVVDDAIYYAPPDGETWPELPE